jgi:hypothetical protein
MQLNSFNDMLQRGEVIAAQLAGEGRPADRGFGVERTWWQVALTNQRLLVIRMGQARGSDKWEVVARLAGERANLRIAHFGRTRADTARLSIDGCGDRIVFIDVDQPPMLPQIQPFLTAWGGPVSGGDSVAGEEIDGYHGEQKDQKMFLYMAGAMLGMFILCCGCFGISVVLRTILNQF